MKYRKTIIAVILAVFLLCMAGAYAGDVNDTAVTSQDSTSTDLIQIDENENISADGGELISGNDEGTFVALEREIQNGYNSNITLKNDYAYEGFGYEDGITISQSITIDGNGSTIDAKGQARIFNILADNVVIKNITFINAKSTYDSGAVSWDGVHGSLSGCSFVNNSADGFGGAIVWLVDSGTVSDCSFVNNSANCGGAIWWDGADGVVSGCSFVNNSANGDSGGAGAIYWHDAPRGVISNCSFIDNSASVYGGALFWDRESYDSMVSGCSFVNSSARDGAAIYWDSGINSNISSCIFVNNSAYNAVIYISSKNLSVNDNIFLNNDAAAFYSDVYNDDANRDYNWFGHNATNYMDNPSMEGCSIWLFLDATAIPNLISLSDSFDITFKLSAYNSVEVSEYDNGRLKTVELTLTPTIGNVNASRTNPGKSVQYIADGAGIGKLTATVENAECSIPLTVTDGTTFSDLNRVINGNDIIVLDRDYTYNSTVDSGFNNGIVISRAVTILGNGHSINAAGRARIFNVRANDVVINNVTFINAKTTGDGGAVLWEGANGKASGCSFVNNSANSGGAICYYRSTNCSVSYSSFIGNSARYGGAVYNNLADNCSVFNCNFENNYLNDVQNAGGAIYWGGNGGVVSGCSFVNNSAECGGVMYWTRDNGNVSGCLFVNNSADEGIIFLYNGNHGKNFSVNDNIFLNNDGVAIYFYEMDSGSNADYNWFGHNATNYNIMPTTTNVEINTWLFIKATSTPNALYLSDSFDVVFRLYAYNSSGISEYDNGRLKEVNMTLTPINGRVNATRTSLEKPVRYYSGGPGGKLTATAEDVAYTIQITSEVMSFSELNDAINGITLDTITLDKDFTYNSTTDGDFKNGIFISRAVTIIGNGHFIDGAGQAKIFYIQSHNVVLKNITFMNAKAGDGGAILWMYDGNANISDCVFINNSATNGGAIKLCGPNSVVSGCIFVNNSASKGAAIFCDWLSEGAVYGCAFLNNSADGIIYSKNDNYDDVLIWTINDNIFLNCNGAAISFYRSVSGSNADYNWFGHNATNYQAVPSTTNVEVNNWLFLNATSNPDMLSFSHTLDVVFRIYAYGPSGISGYDNGRLKEIELTLTPTNGNVNASKTNLEKAVFYTRSDRGFDKLMASIEDAAYTIQLSLTDKAAFLDLNRTINGNDNATIVLDRDYTYDSVVDYDFVEGIVISRAVTIIGNGHTIDAKGQARIFNIQSDNVIIRNVTFINAKIVGYGGAIWFGRDGNVSDCVFLNNSAGYGGAVAGVGSSVVSGCVFVNNSADLDGGAVMLNDGVVCDCVFADNVAGRNGGAVIWVASDDVVVSGCAFVNNSATKGGAIFWGDSDGVVSGCAFVNNSASDGIIYFNNENNAHGLTINDNIFLNNYGVAISFYQSGSASNADYNWFGHNATDYNIEPVTTNVEINKWLFLNATANPDLIHVSCMSDITFRLYAFGSNEVSEYDNGRLKAINLTLTPTNGKANVSKIGLGETVRYTAESLGIGKLVASIENAVCTVTLKITDGTSFSDLNNAISNSNGTIVLDRDYTFNSTLDHDFKEGIVIARAVTIIGKDYVIDAKGQARIFNVQADGVTIRNVAFINANATQSGGALIWEGTNGNISSCSFVNNSAGINGGAVIWSGSDGVVSGCSFADNSADYGGAILWGGSDGVVSTCSFVNNSAQDGGAIVWFDTDGAVSGCVFVNNSADRGIIFFDNIVSGRNLSINDNIFLNNDGIAISFDKSESASNADYNWFGHNATDYFTHPVTTNVEINNWLFLNATANPDSILIFESSDILFKLYSYNESAGTSDYDNSKLPIVNLTVTATRGDVDGIAKLDESIRYDANDFGTGTVTAKIENAEYSIEINNLKDDPNLSIETRQVTYANNTIIAINYNPIATGKVNITLNGKKLNYAFADIYLNATIALGDIGADEYEIIVRYSGDGNFANATANGNLTVTKANSTLEIGDVTLDYGAGTTITVTTEGATAIVARIDGKETSVKGNVIAIPVLDAGTYNLTVTTVPDDNHDAATGTAKITVNKLKTQITAKAITATYNVNKYLVVTLKDSRGNPISGVKISVKLNGIKTLTTDAKGQVKVATKGLAPKAYTAAITFNGNGNYIKSTKSVKVTVKKAKPKIVAKKKTFKRFKKVKKYTVTLKNNVGKVMKKVKLSIKIGKKTYWAKTNSKGKATFKIKKLTKKGKYNAVIKYKGSKYYYKVTKKVRITIK